MNIEEFARRIIQLTPLIIRGRAPHEHSYLTRGEISLPQFWALDYLHHNGKTKMKSLATHLSISPSATTGLIDRLMAQKLVARKNDLQDRRIVWIEVTSKGEDVICDIRRQKVRALMKVFGRISSDDRDNYLNILEKVAKITDASP
jgi:DNA-binding MarR family transcriptional regulator